MSLLDWFKLANSATTTLLLDRDPSSVWFLSSCDLNTKEGVSASWIKWLKINELCDDSDDDGLWWWIDFEKIFEFELVSLNITIWTRCKHGGAGINNGKTMGK